jgi:iron complex outermembrane receptor protein
MDVIEKLGALVFLDADRTFEPEKLIAYEIGYRGQLSPRATVSLTLFDHEYDDLRTIELAPGGGLPLRWGNRMEGRVYGVEAWGSYQATDWWRLSAGLVVQNKELDFKPGASGILGLSQAGNDPDSQAQLRSVMELSDDVTLDAVLRWIGRLPDPAVKSYVELNARLAWNLTEHLELSIAGFDLLHEEHREFTPSDEIARGVFFEARWKY